MSVSYEKLQKLKTLARYLLDEINNLCSEISNSGFKAYFRDTMRLAQAYKKQNKITQYQRLQEEFKEFFTNEYGLLKTLDILHEAVEIIFETISTISNRLIKI